MKWLRSLHLEVIEDHQVLYFLPTNDRNEAQNGKVTCPGSWNYQMGPSVKTLNPTCSSFHYSILIQLHTLKSANLLRMWRVLWLTSFFLIVFISGTLNILENESCMSPHWPQNWFILFDSQDRGSTFLCLHHVSNIISSDRNDHPIKMRMHILLESVNNLISFNHLVIKCLSIPFLII